MLRDKQVLVGVTGGIAAYKTAELVRLLIKAGATVDVIMTKNATEFITPLTFQTLTARPVYSETFTLLSTSDIQHTSLSDRAQLVIVAPATANVIGKYANGIADDLLTTTLLAANAPVLLAPAMNPRMWAHAAVRDNCARLAERGVQFIGPEKGEVACKDEGWGRMSEPARILEAAAALVSHKPLAGKKILITAGPTREPLDPVRYISNRSSGKMGYALAKAARNLGASVTLVSGPTVLPDPLDIEIVWVETAREMAQAVDEHFDATDALIMTAAVADFRPATSTEAKLPKDQCPDAVPLERNPDIIAAVAARKKHQFVVGFAAETGEAETKARAKMERKKLDAIVANDVAQKGIGFDSDHNEVRILFADGRIVPLPKMPKEDLAFAILEKLF